MFVEKHKKIFSFIFLSYWVILWTSIGTYPHGEGFLFLNPSYEFNIFTNPGKTIAQLRFLVAWISTILLIFLYLFFILYKKKIEINKIHLFFFLIFISQLVGLYFNELRDYSAFNSYLPFFGIGTVILFIICAQMGISNVTKYFFWITFSFLIISIITSLLPKIYELRDLNFYKVLGPRSIDMFDLEQPRITGISRSLSIINLFLISLFFDKKKFFTKCFMILIISTFSTFILFMQSRGTILCYFISLVILIFVLQNFKNNFKIKNVLILIILPVTLYFSINNYINRNKSPDAPTFSTFLGTMNKEIKNNNRMLSSDSSGRITIWNYSLKNYNYKKIFGYGSQGDRFFLKNEDGKRSPYGNEKWRNNLNNEVPWGNYYGNNSSSALIYIILSGGIVSAILLILIFYETFKIIFKNRKIIFFNKNSLYLDFSIICLIFFSIRSIFENSFGLFSVDFLITYLSIFCIIDTTKKIQS
jgi:hypothetical protein